MKNHIKHGACSQERADKKQCCYCGDHEHCGLIWGSIYTSEATEESIAKSLAEYRKRQRNGCIIVGLLVISFIILAVIF